MQLCNKGEEDVRPYEGVYTPVNQVISSLKGGHRDYCYSSRDKKDILNAIKKTNLAVMWEDYYNKYNEYDYTVFIPARYRDYNDKTFTLIRGVFYNRSEIPIELECKIVEENRPMLVKHAGEKVPERQ